MLGRFSRRCGGFVVVAVGLGVASVAFAQGSSDEHVPGRLLVQTVHGVSDSAASRAILLSGARVHHNIDSINVKVLEVPERAAAAISQALQRTGLFTFVERDFIAHPTVTPNDPDFLSEWHLSTIQAPYAWGVTLGSSSVPIAVIDSGADSTHPDLGPKLIPGWNFLTGNSNTSDTGCNYGHGTAVSGAAAADTNNSTGVAGVGWANTIMPLVVVPSGCTTSFSDIANAITYAADHGVRIVNISVAGPSSSSTLQNAVNYAWNKGSVIFASAGNNSSSSPMYPAACDYVVAVSSTEPSDTFSSFSNYGNWIDLAAPGDNILTTMTGGGYGYWYGTSFSSPIAAAVGALVLSANPSLTASQLVSLLEQNSDQIGGAGYSVYYGYGRVNAYRAVSAAGNVVSVVPPAVSISNPGNGSTVSGTVSVAGTATSSLSLSSVQLLVDSQQVASGTNANFSFSWNSTGVANGAHTLTVNATDSSGNLGTASLSVNVSNTTTTSTSTAPPVVSITSPANGSAVSGVVVIAASATDSLPIAQVSFYVDNVLKCTDTASPYTCNWNTKKVRSGSHTIKVTAWDTANNSASTSISVTK